MPDDRFADLGGGREKRSAAERLEELDERSPEPQPKPPDPPRRGRYTWVVGIAFVIAIIVGGANLLGKEGAGYRGIPAGKRLAPFAAPLATSDHDNDVNILRKASRGVPAACDVHLAGVVNLCDLSRRPLVVTFVANGGAGCGRQLDRVERVRRSFPQVSFLGVISRKSLEDAKRMVRENRWTFPVALDRDGQLLNLYGIGDCPTTVFAKKGGISAGSRRPAIGEARLRAALAALVEGRPVP
ncbi:MAG TPA: redoxin domain-containing protein [Thermoleophilaceae bacterium]|nr:redoxin domain-containing protein [Thermoleophilaceae bacterium]